VIVEFIHLWDLLLDFQLQPEIEDRHLWKFSSSGQYSAKSAYEGFFLGSTLFGPWERIWKSWAPPKCHFFMWLVAHNKCWTTDRLARRGLPHPEFCPLCDQEEETVDHLLVHCVFAREFWFNLLRQVGLQSLTPQPAELFFLDWWARASSSTTIELTKQGTRSRLPASRRPLVHQPHVGACPWFDGHHHPSPASAGFPHPPGVGFSQGRSFQG